MKALEAKSFDENVKRWETEKQLLTPTMLVASPPQGKINSVRTHSEVTTQFELFPFLKR